MERGRAPPPCWRLGNKADISHPQGKEDIGQEDSFQLLQEQLKEGVASRKQLLKTQQAIVVLYARHVLAGLICHWPRPPHPLLSTSLLGNMDIMRFFCLLDLIMKPLNQQACSEVSYHSNVMVMMSLVCMVQLLSSVVHCMEPTQLLSLTVKASECMRPVNVGTEKRQFQHPTHSPREEKVSQPYLPPLSPSLLSLPPSSLSLPPLCTI